MKLPIDPHSPVPLYHQIAEALRWQVTRGALQAGDALPTLREAAREWGVNLHTIRHAYTELAREGWVESRPSTGTRVLGRPAGEVPMDRARQRFLGRIAAEAERKFDLSARELARALQEYAPASRGTSRVCVVECSWAQCEDLARQLSELYRVEVEPWPLSSAGDLPALPIVATYFHYNEIRRRWPRQLADVAFASIRPEVGVLKGMRASGSKAKVLVCERDDATAETVIADLSALPGADRVRFQKKIVPRPEQALCGSSRFPVLFSPRTWAELSEEQRADARAREIRYVFDAAELAEIARRYHLSPRMPRRRPTPQAP